MICMSVYSRRKSSCSPRCKFNSRDFVCSIIMKLRKIEMMNPRKIFFIFSLASVSIWLPPGNNCFSFSLPFFPVSHSICCQPVIKLRYSYIQQTNFERFFDYWYLKGSLLLTCPMLIQPCGIMDFTLMVLWREKYFRRKMFLCWSRSVKEGDCTSSWPCVPIAKHFMMEIRLLS